MRLLLKLAAVVAALFAATTVNLAAAQAPVSARSWYDSAGTHNAPDNYATGTNGGITVRSYVVFPVPAGTWTAATLHLPAANLTGGPNTLEVYDVTTPIPTLTGGTGGVAAYNDLGSGTLFGTAVVAASGGFVDVALNPAGLAAVNAAGGGSIAFGLFNATNGGGNDLIFGASLGAPGMTLDLVGTTAASIPTLSEWAMIALGMMMAGVGVVALQRRRAA